MQRITSNFLSIAVLIVLAAFTGLAADGDPDTSFGAGGAVNEELPYSGHFSSVVQPDGKILTAGHALQKGTFPLALIRYNSNGSPDSSFGTGGKILVGLPNAAITIPIIVLKPDGKFIVVAKWDPDAGQVKIILLGFNSDGTTDTSYGTGGRTITSFPSDNNASDAHLLPDGKLLVSGSWEGAAYCLARFNANGTLDTTFGTNGNTVTLLNGTGLTSSLAVQTDGKILMNGYFSTSFTVPFNYILFRYNANGTLDTSFDGDGYAITDFNTGYDYGFTLLLQPDGKIISAGHATTGGVGGFGMIRYNTDGSLDGTFGTDGKAVTTFAGGTPQAAEYPAVLMANGKIVIARYRNRESPNFGTEVEIARFNSNGSSDTTFGISGRVNYPAMTQVRDLDLQPDGKLVAVGLTANFGAMGARFLNTDTAAPVNNPLLRSADFDGDGRSDSSVFRNGTWFIEPSSSAGSLAPSSFYGVQFGLATDKLVPADYDGDGKTDVAVYRENAVGSTSALYILRSSDGGFREIGFGTTGDLPVPGDWDGDGKADPAVYRGGAGAQAYFYYLGSLNNPSGGASAIAWGTTGDQPRFGDFDGDRKLDAAVFRPSDSTWYIRSSATGELTGHNYGLPADVYVPGDYDADGKSDLAIFRNGLWVIRRSSDGQLIYRNWGISSDTPAPGDWDGDGKTDVAIWRGGVYYIVKSSSDTTDYRYFGTTGDRVVAGPQ